MDGWNVWVGMCVGRCVGVVGWWMDWGLGLVGLDLGDCVWCVLLPEFVAFATASSKSTPPASHG